MRNRALPVPQHPYFGIHAFDRFRCSLNASTLFEESFLELLAMQGM
jgi:hypothetical protein